MKGEQVVQGVACDDRVSGGGGSWYGYPKAASVTSTGGVTMVEVHVVTGVARVGETGRAVIPWWRCLC